MARTSLAILGVTLFVTSGSAHAAPDVAVAWNDARTNRGMVRGMSSASPWSFVTSAIETGPDVLLRFARGTLYALSRAERTVCAIDVGAWTVTRTYDLGPTGRPEDIAVVSDEVAYIARADATHLLRLDLPSGATTEVVDLSVFADPDGVPDLRMMAAFDGRLFVQIAREDSSGNPTPPALIAVVDMAAEELLDVDPSTPGTQAIQLAGTAPRMKMQVLPASRQLFVSATGIFQDEGGIEVIDLGTLQSMGVFIRELGPGAGADVGAFVMTRSTSGYLVVSTDLLLSSHLKGFSMGGGIFPPEDFETNVDYLVPAIVHDPRTDALAYPVTRDEGHGILGDGVLVLDAGTGERLTPDSVRTGGPPTDLELLCDDPAICTPPAGARFLRADSNADGGVDLSDSLHTIGYLFLGGLAAPCRAAADSNGDGKLDITDPIFLLNHLFLGGLPPPPPFPGCGEDLSPTDLDCRDYDPCSLTPAPRLVTVVDNGPPGNRVDIVILGDGYTAAEIERVFPRHVEALVDHMFQLREDPFPRYGRFFNVHRVDIVSRESGADIPGEGIFRDTALDAVLTSGFPRLLLVDGPKANRALEDALDGTGITADMRLVAVNVDLPGAASGGHFAVYAGGDPGGPGIAVHEIGHSFSNLADEAIFSPDNVYMGEEPAQANLTLSPAGAKWAPWVGFDDPDHPEIGPIGAFEGANYYGRGIYRPSRTSKMSHPGFPFDAVSRQKVILDIYGYVRPLDGWLENGDVLVDPESVHVKVVDPEVIRIEWIVDGEIIAGESEDALHLGFLLPGLHEVVARVHDDTEWVRSDRAALEQRVAWSVLISERR